MRKLNNKNKNGLNQNIPALNIASKTPKIKAKQRAHLKLKHKLAIVKSIKERLGLTLKALK